MFKPYVVVTVLTAAANSYAAISAFTKPEWLRTIMTRVHVSDSWTTVLGILMAAGAVGLLVGLRIPIVGTAAAAGLTLFFIGAIITHVRAHDRAVGWALGFLLLAVTTLLLGLHRQ